MKKAQVQIQETMLVIFIFIVMLLIGFVVFNRFTVESIRLENEKYDFIKTRDLIGSIPSIPEIKCSNLGEDSECIDFLKFKAYKNQNPNYGFKNIMLYIVYPESDYEYVTLTNNKPSIIKGVETFSSLVSVYFPEKGEYKVGELVIEKYI